MKIEVVNRRFLETKKLGFYLKNTQHVTIPTKVPRRLILGLKLNC